MRVYERAYAKINLYLDVTERREDGFHSLRSVMQTVGLYDALTVEAVPSSTPSVTLSVRGRYRVPIGPGNLAQRAADLFMEAGGCPMRVRISLDKHIPVAAGLGGGSADAAAVLRALNRVAGGRMTQARLLELAANLGSDVPFCLLGHTRLCEGRGEIMQVLPPCPTLPLVIAPAPEWVSTPTAFATLDSLYNGFTPAAEHGDLSGMIDALKAKNRDEVTKRLYNIFEDAVLPGCPGAAANRKALRELGARAVLMSGSGPTVFGVFDEEETARSAAAAMRNGAVAVQTV